MKHYEELYEFDSPLKVEDCSTTFTQYLEKEYVSEELRKKLRQSNVLIIPNEGYQDFTDDIYFPSGTSDFYQYLKENSSDKIRVGVCWDKGKYKELSLHADWAYIADIVIRDVAVQLAISLIAAYLIEKYGKRTKETNVKSKMIVLDKKDEHSVIFTYEGPAENYNEVMLKAIDKLPKLNGAKKNRGK